MPLSFLAINNGKKFLMAMLWREYEQAIQTK